MRILKLIDMGNGLHVTEVKFRTEVPFFGSSSASLRPVLKFVGYPFFKDVIQFSLCISFSHVSVAMRVDVIDQQNDAAHIVHHWIFAVK